MISHSPRNGITRTHVAHGMKLHHIGEGLNPYRLRWDDPPTDPPAPTEGAWRNDLPDSMKNEPSIQGFKTVSDVTKGFIETKKMIGADKIILPGEKATPEEISAFHSRLGRPDTAEGYKLPEIKLAEGLPWPEENVKGFRELSHGLGLTPTQVEGLYKWHAETQSGEFNKLVGDRGAVLKATETELRKEYGNAFDQNVTLADSVLQKFTDDKGIAELKATGMNNNPHLIRMLVKIGKGMSEDQLGEGTGSFTKTPQEANAEIQKIRGDLKHPYHLKMHPEHKAAVQQMADLYAAAHPDKKEEEA